MNIRLITLDDRPTLDSWFKAHGWSMPPIESLPPTGYMIDGVCAVWLYHTATNISWMEWLVGNPTANKKHLWRCISELVKYVINESIEEGMPVVMSSIKHKSLMRMYESCGFVATDLDMTNMVYRGGV